MVQGSKDGQKQQQRHKYLHIQLCPRKTLVRIYPQQWALDATACEQVALSSKIRNSKVGKSFSFKLFRVVLQPVKNPRISQMRQVVIKHSSLRSKVKDSTTNNTGAEIGS